MARRWGKLEKDFLPKSGNFDISKVRPLNEDWVRPLNEDWVKPLNKDWVKPLFGADNPGSGSIACRKNAQLLMIVFESLKQGFGSVFVVVDPDVALDLSRDPYPFCFERQQKC